MRRRLTVIISLFLLAITLMAFFFTAGCSSSTNADDLKISGSDGAIEMTAKRNGSKVDVTVRLEKNCGINAMTLTLAYDTDVLTLTGLDEGKALASLDLMTTNTKTEKGYAVTPFKFNYLNANQNDTSTGVMFTLHFSVKKNAKGNTTVGLKYKSGAIKALDNGEIVAKKFSIYPATVTLS